MKNPNKGVRVLILVRKIYSIISNRVKKYLSDQYIQYGMANPNVIIESSISPKDIIKYSPKLPVNLIFLFIIYCSLKFKMCFIDQLFFVLL